MTVPPGKLMCYGIVCQQGAKGKGMHPSCGPPVLATEQPHPLSSLTSPDAHHGERERIIRRRHETWTVARAEPREAARRRRERAKTARRWQAAVQRTVQVSTMMEPVTRKLPAVVKRVVVECCHYQLQLVATPTTTCTYTYATIWFFLQCLRTSPAPGTA